MKKNLLLSLILFALLIIGLGGCNSHNSKNQVEYIPVQENKGDKWGMIGPDGKMLFENEFENAPSVVVNGVFFVEENKGISLYKADKKPQLIPGCEDLIATGYHTEGFIPIVRKDERISL
ncbi:MAG: WG repeat-containing protein, partial [Coprobacter sp.]|nr:WG repeat-containing protein [Coprobacter sp.]